MKMAESPAMHPWNYLPKTAIKAIDRSSALTPNDNVLITDWSLAKIILAAFQVIF